MKYTVKCYKNTGFNAVNIPESPDFVESNFTAHEFPAIDILQNEGLASVTVRATWEEVQGIDYVSIGDAWYSVGTPQMTSIDVAILPLTYDAVTSAGGAMSIDYLDGITERVTVADDSMFAYTQSDEYMTPQESLEIDYGGMLFNNTEIVNTPVESTLDLVYLGEQFDDSGNFTGKGITFTDENGNEVTTPYTKTVSARTQYVIGDSSAGPLSPNTRLYENSDTYPKVQNGLAVVRCLSMEGSVISQVAYPTQFIETIIGADGQYSTVKGKDQIAETTLKFKYSESVANNRVLYGEFNKYGIISASGEKGEFLPEQIGEKTDTEPSVRSVSDPRPDGKPYFRFAKYLKDSNNEYFYVSCISGLQWANVPLTYSKASGSYIDTLQFNNTARAQYANYQNDLRSGYTGIASLGGIKNTALNTIADTAMIGASGLAGLLAGNATDIVQATKTAVSQRNAYSYDIGNQKYTTDQYTIAREKELQNFVISQNVIQPEVLFPFNANLIRDFIGNGVFVYRYRYSNNDLKRIDKILTMYGYKYTTTMSKDLFNSRQKFDYVRATGLSIGGNLPMWKKSLISAQLNAGVRVWHVLPDPGYYTSGNPIKESTI